MFAKVGNSLINFLTIDANFQVHMMTYQEVMGKNISKYEKKLPQRLFLTETAAILAENRNFMIFFM